MIKYNIYDVDTFLLSLYRYHYTTAVNEKGKKLPPSTQVLHHGHWLTGRRHKKHNKRRSMKNWQKIPNSTHCIVQGVSCAANKGISLYVNFRMVGGITYRTLLLILSLQLLGDQKSIYISSQSIYPVSIKVFRYCLWWNMVTIENIIIWIEWMNGWMDGWMDGWIEWMDGWMNEWMDGWMDGWVDEWIEWMNGWID